MYHKNLPRLDPDAYRGYAHVFFTNVTWQRRTLFLQRIAVDICSAMLRRCCTETNCECLVYVFMPDHVHLILHGINDASDVLHCHQMWKGKTGAALARHLAQNASAECGAGFTGVAAAIAAESGSTCGAGCTGAAAIWQHRGYDHVLRRKEYERGALRKMIRYILENPVHKQLAAIWQEYPYLGSMIGDYDIRHPYWWDWFYA